MKRCRVLGILLAALLIGCDNPQAGPDKSIAGAVLGAGWGAGAGAVVGNQVSSAGEGAAVGAGFGLVGGALTGAGFDLNEGAMLEQERTLASLKIQNEANAQNLNNVQNKLDQAIVSDLSGGIHQVFFDADASNLKAGSVANLEVIAEQLKISPSAFKVNVTGHSDDSGDPEYNARLAEARARNVSAYLGSRGISMDRIIVAHHGSERPVASNATSVGRQLNRRVDIYIAR